MVFWLDRIERKYLYSCFIQFEKKLFVETHSELGNEMRLGTFRDSPSSGGGSFTRTRDDLESPSIEIIERSNKDAHQRSPFSAHE